MAQQKTVAFHDALCASVCVLNVRIAAVSNRKRNLSNELQGDGLPFGRPDP